MKEISTRTIKQKPGIYYIKNILNKKVYIGQSKNIYKRLVLHRHHLINNTHDNPHLQRSFNKNLIDNFRCGSIEYSNINLTERELFYINNQTNTIYNIRDASDSIKHPKRSPITEETRSKLKLAKIGKTPKNLQWLQQKNRRKINYYIDDELKKTFSSCSEAADFFGMGRNAFNQYIGKPRNTIKFPKGYRIEYAERREDRYDK